MHCGADFVKPLVTERERPDLMGGGLIRSLGGWEAINEQKAEGKRIKGDERILGSSDFVDGVLKKANEVYERKTLIKNS